MDRKLDPVEGTDVGGEALVFAGPRQAPVIAPIDACVSRLLDRGVEAIRIARVTCQKADRAQGQTAGPGDELPGDAAVAAAVNPAGSRSTTH